MGLPSGLLWRRYNVGASVPEELGLYFSWGNVEGHQESSGYDFSREVYDASPGNAIQANLSLDQDAARANLGAPWRMPTNAEFQELNDNCTSVYTSINGVNGCMFTSNVNGKTLFIPAAGYYDGTTLKYSGQFGYYWASTFFSAEDARNLNFTRGSVLPNSHHGRHFGYSVRAVMEPELSNHNDNTPVLK